MVKGDCVILDFDGLKYGLILHHQSDNDKCIQNGFLIIGESFKTYPTKTEILSSGILGYLYLNEKSDLWNSTMHWKKKNYGAFYTGIKYDIIAIPEHYFQENNSTYKIVTNVNIHPEFYPIPNFHARRDDHHEIRDIIASRLLRKKTKQSLEECIHDSYPLKDILIKE